MSPEDLDIAGRTVCAEAGVDGVPGMVAVAWTIRNRVEADLLGDGKPDWWGEGYKAVCLAPSQFSCWDAANKGGPNDPRGLDYDHEWLLLAVGIMQSVASDFIPDPTQRATHYYAYRIVSPPFWVPKFEFTKQIAGHRFYRDPSAVFPPVPRT